MAKKTTARRSRPTKAVRRPARTAKPARAARPAKAAKTVAKSPSKPAPNPGPKSAPKPAPRKAKWVYTFGDGKAEGRADMRNLLGGKGANLAEMANLGLPVPPGFTITTEVCTWFYANRKSYPKE